MIKHFIAIILLSILVIFGMTYAQQAIQLLIKSHDWLSQLLLQVISHTETGNIFRGLLTIVLIPILFSLVPVILYWFLRRKWFPFFKQLIWIIWLLQIGALLMLYKTAGL